MVAEPEKKLPSAPSSGAKNGQLLPAKSAMCLPMSETADCSPPSIIKFTNMSAPNNANKGLVMRFAVWADTELTLGTNSRAPKL